MIFGYMGSWYNVVQLKLMLYTKCMIRFGYDMDMFCLLLALYEGKP